MGKLDLNRIDWLLKHWGDCPAEYHEHTELIRDHMPVLLAEYRKILEGSSDVAGLQDQLIKAEREIDRLGRDLKYANTALSTAERVIGSKNASVKRG